MEDREGPEHDPAFALGNPSLCALAKEMVATRGIAFWDLLPMRGCDERRRISRGAGTRLLKRAVSGYAPMPEASG